MKTPSLLIYLILLFSNSLILAQTEEPKNECGFEISKENYESLKNPNTTLNLIFEKLKTLSDPARKNIVDLTVTGEIVEIKTAQPFPPFPAKLEVPIVAHIIRSNLKFGGVSQSAIRDAIKIANKKFSDTNLKFKLCKVKYIDSDLHYYYYYNNDVDNDKNPNTPKTFDLLDVKTRNVANKINIYFYPSGSTSWTYPPKKALNVQHIMMLYEHVSNKSTLSHELGHWFNLLHTHGPSNKKLTDELVLGLNCNIAGDLICDTPADHNLENKVNYNTCNFSPSVAWTDSYGLLFDPDVKNLMSYAPDHCQKYFSHLQKVKIQAAFYDMLNTRGYTFDTCK